MIFIFFIILLSTQTIFLNTIPIPNNYTPPYLTGIDTNTILYNIDNDSMKDQNIQESFQNNQNSALIVNFQNVNIKELLKFISKISKNNFIYDSEILNFNVTIVADTPILVSALIKITLDQLSMHGFGYVKEGASFILHVNKQSMISLSENIITDEDNNKNEENMNLNNIVTKIFSLKTLPVVKSIDIIKPLLSEQSILEFIEDGNKLIITDILVNISRIEELLKYIDGSGSLTIGQYAVQDLPIDSIIEITKQIMIPIIGMQKFNLIPHYDASSIFIVSNPYIVEKTLDFMEHIDQRKGETGIYQYNNSNETKKKNILNDKNNLKNDKSNEQFNYYNNLQKFQNKSLKENKFFIYKVKNNNCKHIEESLKNIGNSLQCCGGKLELINAINSATSIEPLNSIVISGAESSLIHIKNLVEELDVFKPQIIIELLIIETDIQDSLLYGVSWGEEALSSAKEGTDNVTSSISFMNKTTGRSFGKQLESASDKADLDVNKMGSSGFNLGIIGSNLVYNDFSFSSIGALFKCLHNKRNTNILMNPKLIVGCNETSKLFVGETTAIPMQELINNSGNFISQSWNYKNIGIEINTTANIFDNSIVSLDIYLHMSKRSFGQGGQGGSTNNSSNFPNLSLLTTSAKVNIPNNCFLMLSGLIQQESEIGQTKVPCLGLIPLISGIMSDYVFKREKKSILIFIRPQIITTAEEANQIAKQAQEIFEQPMKATDSKESTLETRTLYEWLKTKNFYDPISPWA